MNTSGGSKPRRTATKARSTASREAAFATSAAARATSSNQRRGDCVAHFDGTRDHRAAARQRRRTQASSRAIAASRCQQRTSRSEKTATASRSTSSVPGWLAMPRMTSWSASRCGELRQNRRAARRTTVGSDFRIAKASCSTVALQRSRRARAVLGSAFEVVVRAQAVAARSLANQTSKTSSAMTRQPATSSGSSANKDPVSKPTQNGEARGQKARAWSNRGDSARLRAATRTAASRSSMEKAPKTTSAMSAGSTWCGAST